ncbi:MAG: hypothetical protein U0167_05420 [bacterium]
MRALSLATLASALVVITSGLAHADATGPTIAQALREAAAASPSGALAAAASREDWPRDDWDWVDHAPVSPPSEECTVWKAVVASALLPGLGERYAGHPERATVFWTVEGAIWSTFGFYRIQGSLRRDRQLEFANVQAGAPLDQDDAYYEHIGLWLSLTEWQDVVRQDARVRYPDDPAAQQAFYEANKRYDEGQAWSWPDDATRTRYRQLRSRAQLSYRDARLAVGAALFDRLASMVDALALARGHNHRLHQEQSRLDLRIAPTLTTDGLVIGPVVTTRY